MIPLFLLLLHTLGFYLVTLILIPSIAMVTAMLIGDFLKGLTSIALKRVVAPSVFTYLFFSTLSSYLTSAFKTYVIGYFISFLTLLLISQFVARLEKEVDKVELMDSIKYASRFFLFLGLAYLFGIYAPLFYPFLAVSLVYLIASPLPALSKNYVWITDNLTFLLISAFGIGLFYTVLIIPKPAQDNTYVIIAFTIIASLLIAFTAYRLYNSGVKTVERISEEIYEKYQRKENLVLTPEFVRLDSAIKEFVTYGRKEKLITYLTYELTKDGLSYEEILVKLSNLVNYTTTYPQDKKRVNRKVIEREIQKRLNLVKELLREVLAVNKNT
ncbi:hypothetical protein BFU36_12140 [Sulfolobus sp. A20]|nr:hypothetical protein BFU36_12140 [Sulfolobus sp. A20]TRM75591.1 hypothetical protein DJ532_09785 [Sulfolobus sp. A20-N-F8]